MPKAGEEAVMLALPCHPRYLGVARLVVGSLGAQAGLDVEQVDDLKVAVSEAITNAIDHAYEGEEKGAVTVRCRAGQGEITVEVEDSGQGFEPAKGRPRQPSQPGEEGGLGLFLVHEMADEVKVESAPGSGTKITITKRAHR